MFAKAHTANVPNLQVTLGLEGCFIWRHRSISIAEKLSGSGFAAATERAVFPSSLQGQAFDGPTMLLTKGVVSRVSREGESLFELRILRLLARALLGKEFTMATFVQL